MSLSKFCHRSLTIVGVKGHNFLSDAQFSGPWSYSEFFQRVRHGDWEVGEVEGQDERI